MTAAPDIVLVHLGSNPMPEPSLEDAYRSMVLALASPKERARMEVWRAFLKGLGGIRKLIPATQAVIK